MDDWNVTLKVLHSWHFGCIRVPFLVFFQDIAKIFSHQQAIILKDMSDRVIVVHMQLITKVWGLNKANKGKFTIILKPSHIYSLSYILLSDGFWQFLTVSDSFWCQKPHQKYFLTVSDVGDVRNTFLTVRNPTLFPSKSTTPSFSSGSCWPHRAYQVVAPLNYNGCPASILARGS